MTTEVKKIAPRDAFRDGARKAVAEASKHGVLVQDAFGAAVALIGMNPNYSVAGGMSAENLSAQLIRGNNTPDLGSMSAASVAKKLKEVGVPTDRIPSLAQELFDGMTAPSRAVRDVVLSAGQGADLSLGDVLGSGGLRGLGQANASFDGMSAEAWGPDINKLESDERTNFTLAIMRAASSIEDKLFGRVPVTENVIGLRWANPSVYDFAANQKTFATIKNADPAEHSYIDLQFDPGKVNSAPKPMIPNVAADVDGVIYTNADGSVTPDVSGSPLIKVGTECNLKKLCLQDGVFGYDQYNLTDLISPGGRVKTVRVSVSDGTTTGFFDLNTTSSRKSVYVPAPQQETSGDETLSMPIVFTFAKGIKDITGTVSPLADAFDGVVVQKSMTLSSTLNLQYGKLTSGVSNGNTTVTSTTDATTVSDAIVQASKKLTIQVVAFNPGQAYDESNFRKSNMALWVNYGQNKVAMPRPINFFSDYALGQEDDQNVVEATSGVMNLGNSFRTVSIASGAMADVAEASSYAQTSGVDRSQTALADLSLTHTCVRPIVFTTELDFAKETVNLMDESTRGKQMSGRLINRLIPMIADMVAQSLVGLTYADGEPIVLKVLAHSYIADVLFGMYDYFPQDGVKAEAPASGSTFSLTLPNGVRLDIVKVVWKSLENKIAMFVSKDSDRTDLYNFGVIYSRGIASFLFNPTFDGATFRRSVACQRELFVPTTIVGLGVTVKNLAQQLGAYGYTPIDYTTYTDADKAATASNRQLPAPATGG